MDPRVEEILMARAMRDAEEKPSIAQAAGTGAVLGAASGAILGQVPHSIGRGLNGIKDTLAKQQGLSRGQGQNFRSAVKPGFRMAGGLVGAILGGGLGAGTRQMMIQESPAAALLAKAQAQGDLGASDREMLQRILTDTYSTMGLT